MPTLHELQKQLRGFLLEGDAGKCTGAMDQSPIIAADRLHVFRNNCLVTHTGVLAVVFPVVRRLVDPAFFAYLAHEFLQRCPPTHPCLSEYGAEFAGFVSCFPPVREIVYLQDVARLEWAISRISSAKTQGSMSLNQFALCPGDPACARLKLQSSVRFIESQYPIDLIWLMNQSGNEVVMAELENQSVYLQVRMARRGHFQRIDRASWLFRSSIAFGETLGAAAEIAMHFEQQFDLPGAIAALFSEELVVSRD